MVWNIGIENLLYIVVGEPNKADDRPLKQNPPKILEKQKAEEKGDGWLFNAHIEEQLLDAYHGHNLNARWLCALRR